MLVTILEVAILGLLLGGLYGLIAMGLSLQYGVARILNIAHGEFIMVGAIATWALYTAFGVNPLLSLAIVGPAGFVVGYVLHRTLFKWIADSSAVPAAFESSSMLASFGLMFIIKNIALRIWGPEIRQYSYLLRPVDLAGALFGANRLVTLAFAVVIGLAFFLFLTRTRLGKAIRAAAQDPAVAGLMGVNINNVLALCFGFGAALAAMSGMLISMCYRVHGEMGMEYTVVAMIVVVLGGLGSIPGSFIGGFLLGLVGTIVTYLDPSLTVVAYYLIFVLLLLIKPTGLMGTQRSE
jgi:branched-chain amino acid transport system permease protein